jgi:trans-2-enoyl-CoA reductase
LANDFKQSSSNRDSFDTERLKQRIELLDERLDNIDSVVTAVAERVMKQPVSILLTCPHCGKNIEVALVGQQKPAI